MWKIAFCVCAYLSVATARADLRAALQVRPNVHTVREGTLVSISCGAQDCRKIKTIELEFGRQEKLKWEDSDEDRLSYSIANGRSKNLSLLRRTVNLLLNYSLTNEGPRRLSISFTARASHSGTVKCSVKSTHDINKISTRPQRKETSHALTVEWSPTVRQLLIHPLSPKEGDSVNVSCIFDRGHPETIISDPRPVGILRGQPRAVPAPGGRLRLSWMWKMSRGENEAEVGCRLDNGSNKKQRLVVVSSSGCGGPRDLIGVEGVIRSQPVGQSQYSNNAKCTWIIKGRPDNVVRLRFEVFLVESCDNCACDHLEIYELGIRRKKLCGSDRPSDITSISQTLTLKFSSDGSVLRRGFLIQFILQGKPRSVTFFPVWEETFAGEFVNCSADGNPQPEVMMEGFERTARGVSTASLLVPTTAEGGYSVKCTAENSVGAESKKATITVQKNRLPTYFSVSQINQDLNSTISLRCGPRSLKDGVFRVTILFAGGQKMIWNEEKIQNNRYWIKRHHFNEFSKFLSVDVLASPFMKGRVRCRLESTNHSSVGGEETQITLRWRAQLQRIFTRIENRTERGRMIEGDTLTVTCEVEVGSSPTKEQVQFEGLNMKGGMIIGDDLRNHDGWTLRNESTQVRLSWRHDGETIRCWLGGKKLTKRLEVEYAPRNLSIDPLSVGPGQAVRCSAGGRPTPTVSIRVTDPRLGWKLKSGDGQTELVMGKKEIASGMTFVCEAENVHGQESMKAVLIVKNSFDIVGLVTSAVFNVVLLLTVVILGIFLARMRRQTSSITRPAHTELSHIRPVSNIYNTEAEHELFGTSANHSRPSERFESAANCPESENGYEDVIQQLQNRLEN